MMKNHFVYSIQHDAWWREGSRGYTADIMQAGFYTQEEAEEIVRRGDGERAVLAGLAMRIVNLERYRVREAAHTAWSNSSVATGERRCKLEEATDV